MSSSTSSPLDLLSLASLFDAPVSIALLSVSIAFVSVSIALVSVPFTHV
ncbi:MAG: hypothetical protein QNJ54_36330 [Prochloraceae cyanobacterium]|nr:hypothetical protein [Prochloraceae cyanobacterium]